MNDNDIPEQTTKRTEDKTIINVYAALAASLVMGFVPHSIFALFSALLFTGATIVAYRLRRRADPDSLTGNHMTFIVRTIWIASALVGICTGLASLYVLSVYDPSPVHSCVDSLMSSGEGGLEGLTQDFMDSCMNDFMAVNGTVFLIGAILAGTPVLLYSVYRLARGLSRALKGHRIGNVNSWL